MLLGSYSRRTQSWEGNSEMLRDSVSPALDRLLCGCREKWFHMVLVSTLANTALWEECEASWLLTQHWEEGASALVSVCWVTPSSLSGPQRDLVVSIKTKDLGPTFTLLKHISIRDYTMAMLLQNVSDYIYEWQLYVSDWLHPFSPSVVICFIRSMVFWQTCICSV